MVLSFITSLSVTFYSFVIFFVIYADRDTNIERIFTDSIEYFPGTHIRNYTLIMALSVFISYYLLIRKRLLRFVEKKLFKGNLSEFFDWIFLWIVAFGFVSARFVNVVTSKHNWMSNPHESFFRTLVEPWHGGIAIEGGIIGGTGAGYFIFRIISRLSALPLLKFGDTIIPHILIAQSLGRWGNFFNQEVLGKVVNPKWLGWLPDFFKKYLHYQYEVGSVIHHPFFLYESLLTITSWIFLIFILPRINRQKKKISIGLTAFSYFFLYGTIRSSMELFRDDVDIAKIGTIPALFYLSLLFALFGFGGMIWCQMKREKINKKWSLNDLFFSPTSIVIIFAAAFLAAPILFWLNLTL